MAVSMQRRNIRVAECPYGCCTPVYGKNVRNIRRSVKHRERAAWKRQAREDA